jgi:hypothetical protein
LHEDKILCCIILVFQLIDYQVTAINNKITIDEAYETLDYLRTISHQPRVRAYLLKAIVALIEENMQNSDKKAINYISNLNEHERDQLVDGFKNLYLEQRAELSGGDYQLKINDKLVPSWELPTDRPKTSVEMLMKDWLAHPDKNISQIATRSFLIFTEIEESEKQQIGLYVEEQKRLSELQEATEIEIPEYNSAIEADPYTIVFLKIASQIILPQHVQKLQNIAPVLMQTSTVSDIQLAKLLANFDDASSEQDQIVLQLVFLYNLFKGKDFDIRYNPFKTGFWANIMLTFGTGGFTLPMRNQITAWAPIVIQNSRINTYDVDLILRHARQWGSQTRSKVMLFRFLYGNSWIWWVFSALVLYLIIR